MFNSVNLDGYAYCHQKPVKLVYPDGNETVKKYTGTIEDIICVLNNSKNKVARRKGDEAAATLFYLDILQFRQIGSYAFLRIPLKPAVTDPLNKVKGRYVYTEKTGWIHMAHFMYYAGIAYSTGKITAMIEGYFQKMLDPEYSKFSYEDLRSDYNGADFDENYFDSDSDLTLGEQVEAYMKNVLGATDPQNAKKWEDLPEDQNTEKPIKTNMTINKLDDE